MIKIFYNESSAISDSGSRSFVWVGLSTTTFSLSAPTDSAMMLVGDGSADPQGVFNTDTAVRHGLRELRRNQEILRQPIWLQLTIHHGFNGTESLIRRQQLKSDIDTIFPDVTLALDMSAGRNNVFILKILLNTCTLMLQISCSQFSL